MEVLGFESINNWGEDERADFRHGSGGGDGIDLVHYPLDKLGCLAILGELEVYCEHCDGCIY